MYICYVLCCVACLLAPNWCSCIISFAASYLPQEPVAKEIRRLQWRLRLPVFVPAGLYACPCPGQGLVLRLCLFLNHVFVLVFMFVFSSVFDYFCLFVILCFSSLFVYLFVCVIVCCICFCVFASFLYTWSNVFCVYTVMCTCMIELVNQSARERDVR